MRIFLIGFMGCGKSSLGKRLARRIGYDFADIDKLVEKTTGKSIQKIVDNGGEQAFRHIERNVLFSLSDRSNIVISTGGGTPCFFDNMDHILKTGKSVYLKMSPSSLAKRLENAKYQRPLIKDVNGENLVIYINSLLEDREKYYLRANCIIKGENAKPNHIVSLIFG